MVETGLAARNRPSGEATKSKFCGFPLAAPFGMSLLLLLALARACTEDGFFLVFRRAAGVVRDLGGGSLCKGFTPEKSRRRTAVFQPISNVQYVQAAQSRRGQNLVE